MKEGHDENSHDHGHRDEAGHDQAGPESEEKNHYRQDDPHGLQQAPRKVIRFFGNMDRLKGDDIKFHPDRIFAPESLYLSFDLLSQLDDVSAFAQIDGDGESGLPPVVHFRCGRVDVTAMDFYHIPEIDDLLPSGQLYDRLAQVIDRVEISRGFEDDLLVLGVDLAAGYDYVSRRQDLLELQG